MNIIALTDTDFTLQDLCVLQDERASHIQCTLRSAVGDTVRVGKIDGLLGTADITAMSPGSVTLKVCLQDTPPPPLPITLFLALPRPNMLARLLRDVTSLGIKHIHLFHSEKVEKSFWQTPALTPGNIHTKLVEGLTQARDTRLPHIHTHQRLRDVIGTVLPDTLTTHTGVLADPYSPQASLPANFSKPVALVVGPEGGFTERERQQFLQAGCMPLWLGSRILRVETAVVTAVGHLATRLVLP